jgi:hypothetical protein
MTTFLSRVAARAVGTQAAATPRPRSLFESAPRSELVEAVEQPVSSWSAPPSSPRIPLPQEPSEPLPDTAPPSVPERPARDEAKRRRPGDEPGPVSERVGSPQREVEVVAERFQTVAPAGSGRASTAEAVVLAIAAPAPPRARAPVVVAPGTARRPLRSPAHDSAIEPEPEVRVHIGRLEVRANIQPAPPPRKRDPERAPEISLTDYLRGSRRR